MNQTQQNKQAIKDELDRVMPSAVEAAQFYPISVFCEDGKLGYKGTAHITEESVVVEIPEWEASQFKTPQEFSNWVKEDIFGNLDLREIQLQQNLLRIVNDTLGGSVA